MSSKHTQEQYHVFVNDDDDIFILDKDDEKVLEMWDKSYADLNLAHSISDLLNQEQEISALQSKLDNSEANVYMCKTVAEDYFEQTNRLKDELNKAQERISELEQQIEDAGYDAMERDEKKRLITPREAKTFNQA